MLTYRNATQKDVAKIVEIYNSVVPTRMVTADTERVTVESKQAWFEEHNMHSRPLWMVENEQEQTVGWVSFQSFYGRPAYNATVEISIYLDVAQRGKGVGKEILHHCMTASKDFGVKTLIAFIFSHNEPSLHLFKQCGFEEWGHLPNIALLDDKERGLVILGKRIG